MTPFSLAWSNSVQQRRRTFVSVLGVGFAVLLAFMQLGFRDAVGRNATLFYDHLDFDLILASSEYINLASSSTFPRRRLVQAEVVPDIVSSRSASVMIAQWRSPRPGLPEDHDGFARRMLRSILYLWRSPPKPVRQDRVDEPPRLRWTIFVLGVEPYSLDRFFRPPVGPRGVFRTEAELDTATRDLARLETVLMDRTSRKEYGDAETWKRGTLNEINGRRVEIVGELQIGTGFSYNGLLVTSESTLTRILGYPDDRVSFGLLRLKDRSVSPARLREIQREVERVLPSDVKVYTRAEIEDKERSFWLGKTAVGQFFTAGVIISLLVGGVFVYQMMSADISRRLGEYATIRALGYPRDYLTHVVYWQGFLLAVAGYLPGLATALVCYALAERQANIPLAMTATRIVFVLVLAVVMCMFSAAAASRAVYRANPADLF